MRTPATEQENLGELVDDFLGYIGDYRQLAASTVHEYGTVLRSFRAFLRERLGEEPKVSDVSGPVILEWLRSRRVAPATVRVRRGAIGSFFRYLQSIGRATVNPAHGLPLPKKRKPLPRALAREEVGRLLAAVVQYPEYEAAYRILLGTGLRASELCGLKLGDVDMDRRTMLVRGKGGKEREVPLSQGVIDAIRAYLPHRKPRWYRRHEVARMKAEGWDTDEIGEAFGISPATVRRDVRQGKKGNGDSDETPFLVLNHYGDPLGYPGLLHTCKVVARHAGVDPRKVSPHVFRHTFATELVRGGVGIQVVQALLGHADLSTTARYLAVGGDEKGAAVEVLTW